MNVADELLRGPRGRRMCLAYLLHIDPDVRTAAFWTAHRLDPNPGRIMRFFDDGSDASEHDIPPDPFFTESDVASLIDRADLASLAPDAERAAIRDALRDSVDSDQWAVQFVDVADSTPLARHSVNDLAGWAREEREAEERARHDRPADATAMFTGEWDAVHLTTLAYLSAATRLILIDDEYASIIGGWAPDATIWLGDTVRERDEPRREWTREPTGTLWTVRA